MNDFADLSISEIKKYLNNNKLNQQQMGTLVADSRVGVQKLIKSYQKQLRKHAQIEQRFREHLKIEQSFWQNNKIVAGIDEVGRGPLAGPVVTAAVILPPDVNIIDINDSKQLTDKKRHQLYPHILSEAIDVSVAVGSNQLIDQENIYHATELTMAKSISNLFIKPNEILVDAMHIPVNIPQMKLIKGDARSVSIGAASIIAKVYRDELMKEYAQMYPHYGFEQNAGYGTKIHLIGLKKFGICPIHRKTFAPVKNIL